MRKSVSMVVCVVLGVVAAACGSSAGDGGANGSLPDGGGVFSNDGTDGGRRTQGTEGIDGSVSASADSGAPSSGDASTEKDGSTSTDAGVDASNVKPVAPFIVSVLPAAMGSGLDVTWTLSTPCDTIDIERQDQIHGFPSTQHPAQPPQFPGLPGASTTYTDGSASDQTSTYSYRARCVIGGDKSTWGNIEMHAGN